MFLETSSAFDFEIIKRMEEKKKFKKESYIVCNGFKTDAYVNKITEAFNNGFKNVIPILDNLDEVDKFGAITEPMNIGMHNQQNRPLIDNKMEYNPQF